MIRKVAFQLKDCLDEKEKVAIYESLVNNVTGPADPTGPVFCCRAPAERPYSYRNVS